MGVEKYRCFAGTTRKKLLFPEHAKHKRQSRNKGTKVPTEIVQLCAEQIAAMCACLAKVHALPQEVPGYILEGFTQCLVVEFRDIHRFLNTANIVHQMRAITRKWNSKETLASVVKHCREANNVFHFLNLTNKWNIP